jgi:Domain of unknown function (DUF4188)
VERLPAVLGGTGFWHETYRMKGGIEAIYDDIRTPVGMMHFAPLAEARGSMFSARRRLAARGATEIAATDEPPAVVTESAQ